MSTAISVSGLRKRYGDHVAVDGISLEVEEGEIFGLIGPNGSGKTTTVEGVQGPRRPDAGVVAVLGLDAQPQRRELRRRIGCQLQKSALPDRIRVWEALDLFASLSPTPNEWRTLLDQWGLVGMGRAPFASLSGGKRQRLFVALALVSRPEVVFLDEMSAGLDPAARRVAWSLIDSIREQGATVVLVTHFMDEAERLCDRVALVHRGRLLALDTPATLAASVGQTRIRFSAEREVSWLERVHGMTEVRRSGPEVEVTGSGTVLALVAAALVERGLAPEDLRAERPSLEEAFLRLAGEES